MLAYAVVLSAVAGARAECKPPAWAECRADLRQALFNSSGYDQALAACSRAWNAAFRVTNPPSPDYRPPDFVKRGAPGAKQDEEYRVTGLPGPGAGTGVGGVEWTNNLTSLVWSPRAVAAAARPGSWASARISFGQSRAQSSCWLPVWTISGPHISLNSTVLYSLNTSSRSPSNYPPPPYTKGQGPGAPTDDAPWGQAEGFYPSAPGDTLVIYHNGHETSDCIPNYDGVVDHFNSLAYDVFEMMMPLIGCNQAYQYNNPR
eukprot:gene5699-5644_t